MEEALTRTAVLVEAEAEAEGTGAEGTLGRGGEEMEREKRFFSFSTFCNMTHAQHQNKSPIIPFLFYSATLLSLFCDDDGDDRPPSGLMLITSPSLGSGSGELSSGASGLATSHSNPGTATPRPPRAPPSPGRSRRTSAPSAKGDVSPCTPQGGSSGSVLLARFRRRCHDLRRRKKRPATSRARSAKGGSGRSRLAGPSLVLQQRVADVEHQHGARADGDFLFFRPSPALPPPLPASSAMSRCALRNSCGTIGLSRSISFTQADASGAAASEAEVTAEPSCATTEACSSRSLCRSGGGTGAGGAEAGDSPLGIG